MMSRDKKTSPRDPRVVIGIRKPPPAPEITPRLSYWFAVPFVAAASLLLGWLGYIFYQAWQGINGGCGP